jgi:hypothetical protein
MDSSWIQQGLESIRISSTVYLNQRKVYYIVKEIGIERECFNRSKRRGRGSHELLGKINCTCA